MSRLDIYTEPDGEAGAAAPIETLTDGAAIAERLGELGVRFERWQADRPLAAAASPEEVIAAYREDIDRLMAEHGFQSVDVVSLTPDHPDREALRAKFLDEHVHSDFEVRFFVDGRGLFYLHPGDRIYAVLCEKGDLISVPAHTRHWFDMGPAPDFKAIRLFTTPDGWKAEFTGDPVASRLPRLGD